MDNMFSNGKTCYCKVYLWMTDGITSQAAWISGSFFLAWDFMWNRYRLW